MAQNLNQIDIGQSGGAYLSDTDVFTPPTGKIVTAIYILDSATKFKKLLSPTVDALYYAGTSVTATAAGNGTNAEAIGTGTTFPVGTWIYGRYNTVQLIAGSIFLYFSEE
tara:strand:- start:1011 stop:1340 length:330 start_codon:yes stop_codon:yes gene_type:complete